LRVCSCAATRRPPEVNGSHRQPIERSSLVLGRGLSTWDRAGAHRPAAAPHLPPGCNTGGSTPIRKKVNPQLAPVAPPGLSVLGTLAFGAYPIERLRPWDAKAPSADAGFRVRAPIGPARRGHVSTAHPLGRRTDAAMHFQSWAIPPTRAEGPRFGEARDPEEFERAMAEAKAEGNLSRANVVRYGAMLGSCALPCRPADGPGT
jgi:hypothetical protein